MGEKTRRTILALFDDPVARTMGMLRGLPLESTAVYLEMVSGRAGQLGLITKADQERISELLRRAGVSHIDRAA